MLGSDSAGDHVVTHWTCGNPECRQVVAFLRRGKAITGGNLYIATSFRDEVPARYIVPMAGERPVDSTVPPDLAQDYREATAVLSISPKASAALSRRCLQSTIRETKGVKKRTLDEEIEEVIAQGMVSTELAGQLDAVRQIGNFAAHSTKSTTTGEIVDVEPQEAEWNLDVLDGLFDEWFVRPAALGARKARLNTKLTDAGKPTI
jgi:Domain of unknown function (DUF4145)